MSIAEVKKCHVQVITHWFRFLKLIICMREERDGTVFALGWKVLAINKIRWRGPVMLLAMMMMVVMVIVMWWWWWWWWWWWRFANRGCIHAATACSFRAFRNMKKNRQEDEGGEGVCVGGWGLTALMYLVHSSNDINIFENRCVLSFFPECLLWTAFSKRKGQTGPQFGCSIKLRLDPKVFLSGYTQWQLERDLQSDYD